MYQFSGSSCYRRFPLSTEQRDVGSEAGHFGDRTTFADQKHLYPIAHPSKTENMTKAQNQIDAFINGGET
ncbi:hypothetical protein QR680_005176 [Steinernema hermaphroditum]|uniref:Uncharacterized protein n=1 Tax=Steinernema hermaphroditum TaxID=289476 RepID=A0AA39HR41_9BILA|nr:hypothetical protein QR680_005176 [Steinernema hermaphroditum]